jgi:hypothetical protein
MIYRPRFTRSDGNYPSRFRYFDGCGGVCSGEEGNCASRRQPTGIDYLEHPYGTEMRKESRVIPYHKWSGGSMDLIRPPLVSDMQRAGSPSRLDKDACRCSSLMLPAQFGKTLLGPLCRDSEGSQPRLHSREVV